MAVHLSFLLIFTGLAGSHSITTVSKVSVKHGDEITIPCLYDSRYINNVKYVCKGYYWSSCSTEIRTDSQNSSRKFSISDDKIQNIFTVTIKDVTNKDDDDYWCVVEGNEGSDDGKYFHLSPTGATPSVSVDRQEITGFKGDNINIKCYYRNDGVMKWCKLDRSCVTGSSGSIDGTGVTISREWTSVSTVTMSGLRTESSGWYSCDKEDFQMPVHVTVTDRPTTTTSSLTTVSASTVNHNPVSADQALTTVQGELQSPSHHVKSFGIRLSVIFVVMVTLFIWFIFKRHKQRKVESSATITAEGEVRYMRNTSGEPEVSCGERCGRNIKFCG
ncbi:polymeric immunoglobulin receptor-like isoform X2 [Cottoperca gobio]|uniref:polymeric immunoglobulin receptor-like isoform X2 n=1 Tax=Cottoperca gobio TaxID=56716 RepID=UPI00110E909D|nr:polymeric immunoglobulin receptor-like isoform X2 [Cottoperca gobio]